MKKIISIIDSDTRDYYCNIKFKSMKIDFEKNTVYNCDAARPQNINLNWLENNPGQLFNNPKTVQERAMMLNNQRNSSCEFNCFRAEDIGAISPRIIRQGYIKTHTELNTRPVILDITLGSDCNLTCTYCVKEYSSAWRNDLRNNGNYPVTMDIDRYTITKADRIVHKLSQNEKKKSQAFQLVNNEIGLISSGLERVFITGGEPFLHNNLFELLEKIKDVPTVAVFSGLGVNINRLDRIIGQLKEFKNVLLILSCENVGKYLEFNRHGTRWDEYQTKIDLIKQSGINFVFHNVLSNLSVFGFKEFLDYYRDHISSYDFVYKPEFMSVYVMDEQSKEIIKKEFDNDPLPWKDYIYKSISATPTDTEVYNLKFFIKEFSRRRNISIIDVYPKSFVNWINGD
jgi:wyosine [tRNA(Phe)-imidazoG37] synthetase (radical SAM superfamily)